MTREGKPVKRLNRVQDGERGYNLIEVLIAIAILGSVVLSVMTLFVLARRNVYSGKQMSQATALAQEVVEDLANMTIRQVYAAFLIDGTVALANYTVDGIAYPNALIRSTNPTIVASPPTDISFEIDPPGSHPGFITQWTDALASSKKLEDGSITLMITPSAQPDPGAFPIVNATGNPSAQVLKLRVVVKWKEGLRSRSAYVDSLKVKF